MDTELPWATHDQDNFANLQRVLTISFDRERIYNSKEHQRISEDNDFRCVTYAWNQTEAMFQRMGKPYFLYLAVCGLIDAFIVWANTQHIISNPDQEFRSRLLRFLHKLSNNQLQLLFLYVQRQKAAHYVSRVYEQKDRASDPEESQLYQELVNLLIQIKRLSLERFEDVDQITLRVESLISELKKAIIRYYGSQKNQYLCLVSNKIKLNLSLDTEMYSQIKKNFKKLCCRYIFSNEYYGSNYSDFHCEYMRSVHPDAMLELAKNIANFMSMSGGVILVGNSKLPKDKQQQGFQVEKEMLSGRGIRESAMESVLEGLYKCVNRVKPKHRGFPEVSYSSKKSQPQFGQVIKINEYISVQFVPIVHEKTCRNQTQDDQKLCIARVMVKAGHPMHVYHIVENQSSDFRTHEMVFLYQEIGTKQEKSFKNASELIYSRLITYKVYEQNGIVPPRPKFHPGCRVSMQLDPELYFIGQDYESNDIQ